MDLTEQDFTAFLEALLLHYVMTDDGDIVVYDPETTECDHANFALNGQREFKINMDAETRILYARRLRRKLEELRIMKERGATAEEWIDCLRRVLTKIEGCEQAGCRQA
jgi:hypothetical protein